MKVFDWTKHAPMGFYSQGVLIVGAETLERARSLALAFFRNEELSRYRGTPHSPGKVMGWVEATVARLDASVVSKEPDVHDGEFVFYQREVE